MLRNQAATLPVTKNQPVHGNPEQKALGWGLQGKWRERGGQRKEGKWKRGKGKGELAQAAAICHLLLPMEVMPHAKLNHVRRHSSSWEQQTFPRWSCPVLLDPSQ